MFHNLYKFLEVRQTLLLFSNSHSTNFCLNPCWEQSKIPISRWKSARLEAITDDGQQRVLGLEDLVRESLKP